MQTSNIPILITGRVNLANDPSFAARIVEGLKPKYDVVHFCFSPEAFVEEFPNLMKGESVTPSSALGSNIQRGKSLLPRKPVAVIAGGGLIDEEVAAMQALEGGDQIPWVHMPKDFRTRFGPQMIGLENAMAERLDALNLS
ncbi:hypothetical protein OE88DRAFT_1736649 [Heliocybe sulcata]|uniref:Uncharacterized protein n=1 Tax=Heliocybe sulcata TaxID=5364 RepID=A0A5C3N0R0_9AGAM|nr:hypothetical protein OE88DRAFT_1736649 [Heliocybe sulcata]